MRWKPASRRRASLLWNSTTIPPASRASRTTSCKRDRPPPCRGTPGRLEPRHPQPVYSTVSRLDGEAALHGQQAREQHSQPEQTGGGLDKQRSVLVESKTEQEKNDERIGDDLVEGHFGAALDAQVLGRDDRRHHATLLDRTVTPHSHVYLLRLSVTPKP